MKFIPIKTRALLPPKDDLIKIIDECVDDVKNGDIIFISSKIVAIHQGNTILNDGKISKTDLIKREAEAIIETDVVPGKSIFLTIKNNILIPSAGIDESNGNGYFILWPKEPVKFAKEVYDFLSKKFNINELGIVITDSTTRPLKWGVVGIAMASYGIEPLIDKRGDLDIFGKELGITQINVIDALAGTAVFIMGEADEQIPIVIARGFEGIKFNTDITLYDKMAIKPEEDLFGVLLKPLIDNMKKNEEKSN